MNLILKNSTGTFSLETYKEGNLVKFLYFHVYNSIMILPSVVPPLTEAVGPQYGSLPQVPKDGILTFIHKHNRIWTEAYSDKASLQTSHASLNVILREIYWHQV